MKRKAVSILIDVVNKIDAQHHIDKTDTLIGKHVVIDAEDLDEVLIDIRKVKKLLEQEIEFDDALKGELSEDLDLCHIHAYNEWRADCHLCAFDKK